MEEGEDDAPACRTCATIGRTGWPVFLYTWPRLASGTFVSSPWWDCAGGRTPSAKATKRPSGTEKEKKYPVRHRRETHGVFVAAELHVADLQPRPLRVELGRPDERNVDAQVAVHRRTVDANENAERDARPRRVLGSAVETRLPTCQTKWASISQGTGQYPTPRGRGRCFGW